MSEDLLQRLLGKHSRTDIPELQDAGFWKTRFIGCLPRDLRRNRVPIILEKYHAVSLSLLQLTVSREISRMLLDDTIKSTVQDAAKKLTRHRKRDFMAKVAEDYLGGSARKAERGFGWKRQSVQLGLHERRTGLICVDHYQARGRHKSEVILPHLEADIHGLVEPQAQADRKFQSLFGYARISARAVRAALIEPEA